MNGPRTKPSNIDYVRHFRCPKCRGGVVKIEDGYKCSLCKWKVMLVRNKATVPQRVWRFLDYRKSIIGAILVAGGFITSAFVPPIGEGIKWLGYATLGGGLAHKGVKGYKSVKSTGGEKVWWETLIYIIIDIIKQFKKAR